jgi:aerobic C4-dicarboxylate transport protein
MSEGRALTNLIGNGVATVVVVAKWEQALDADRLRAQLARPVAAQVATE